VHADHELRVLEVLDALVARREREVRERRGRKRRMHEAVAGKVAVDAAAVADRRLDLADHVRVAEHVAELEL